MQAKPLIVLSVGLIIAAGFYFLASRHNARLVSLAGHGELTAGRITGYSEFRSRQYPQYIYTVNGMTFEGSIGPDHRPPIGDPIIIHYLPEDPSIHQANTPVTLETVAAHRRDMLKITAGTVAVTLVFFALYTLGNAPSILGKAIWDRINWNRISVSTALLVLICGMVLPENAESFNRKAFGERPLGLTPNLFVALLVVVLLLPMYWVIPCTLKVVQRARASGYTGRFATTKFLRAGGQLTDEERRCLWVSRAGGAYLFMLAVAWIAYTSWRGV